MRIYPAIDISGGRAVRLLKGDYSNMTVYGADPAAVAEEMVLKGASHMHLVDLDGAKSGTAENMRIILEIKRRSGAFCEVGGGIRSLDMIERYLGSGIDRVILGTAAADGAFLSEAVRLFGDRIAAGVDARNGRAAVRGWTEDSGIDAFELCERLADAGVRTLIYTEIARDGTLGGIDAGLYERLAKEVSSDVIASGGIASIGDVAALKKAGAAGAIIGKAYYTGAIDLAEAVALAEEQR